jgi:acetyltransferase-like isoleucine patch superfamily enzyme
MIASIKNYIISKAKTSEWVLNFIAAVYNSATSSSIKGNKQNIINYKGTFLKKTSIKIKGVHNTVNIAPKDSLMNCMIYIAGNNCKITIEKNCTLKNVQLWIEDDGGEIIIENRTTMEGGHIAATEGESIVIGTDCMFSNKIEIRSGDSHSIYQKDSSLRINPAKGVRIGNHVWLGADVKVLKGSVIHDGAIIGTGSIVTGVVKEHSIYAGNPAKLLKENVNWKRER